MIWRQITYGNELSTYMLPTGWALSHLCNYQNILKSFPVIMYTYFFLGQSNIIGECWSNSPSGTNFTYHKCNRHWDYRLALNLGTSSVLGHLLPVMPKQPDWLNIFHIKSNLDRRIILWYLWTSIKTITRLNAIVWCAWMLCVFLPGVRNIYFLSTYNFYSTLFF